VARGDRRTALIVEVPEAQPLYDAWRRRWDPPRGVPAHVTLLVPFRAPELVDDALLADLRELFAAAAPFEVEFRRVDFFEEVAWLAPEPAEPFVALTEALVARYPEHPPYGEAAYDRIVPHLTLVNRAPPELLADVGAAVEPELPIRTRATRATLLEETAAGAWRPRASFALRG
jgi:2'-5' RNA ligase